MAVVTLHSEAVLKAVEQSDKMDGLVKKNSDKKNIFRGLLMATKRV